MRAISRESVVVFVTATIFACGQIASTNTADTSDASANDAGVSSGQVAARACSPLAPPAFLTVEAVTPDGHYLVVTKDPSMPSAASLTHLFYGTPDHMIEGRITHEDNNCAWAPSFEVGGATYDAVIAYACGTTVASRIFVGTEGPMALTFLRGEGLSADAGATVSPETFTYSCF